MKPAPIIRYMSVGFVNKYRNIAVYATDCACPDGIPYCSLALVFSESLNRMFPVGLGSRINNLSTLFIYEFITKKNIYKMSTLVLAIMSIMVAINNIIGP